MKTLKDLGDLSGKRVLVRADFNVPLKGTTITDDGRIRAALPTIKALREQGAKVILMAHLGRPKGQVVPELSLAPVAQRLGELLGTNVVLTADTYGEDAQAKVAAMNNGDVVLLENALVLCTALRVQITMLLPIFHQLQACLLRRKLRHFLAQLKTQSVL